VLTSHALLPEFDHLYLDMNGIIHGCTHSSTSDVCDRLSERTMMMGIVNYIDRIVTQIVKPKVSVYMAVDGVAPRAKMNQQRSRRFRSARDLEEALREKRREACGGEPEGDVLGDTFDSNCITPGTEFMGRVSAAIKYYIQKKLKEDPAWRDLKVIFSGQEVAGEGEHKIMQHIREMRATPGYRPNTRHCMYGQDADLIMLGLASHEPHFSLLREIVNFGVGFNHHEKKTGKTVLKFVKKSDFQILHLSVLREYLEMEFANGLDNRTYDLEAILDDFIFLTFLVGNDFLPHLPALDIGEGAFDLLFDVYRRQRASWGEGQYLTCGGRILDASRLERFLAEVGETETTILEKRAEDDAKYLVKRRRWDKRDGKPPGPSDAQLEAKERDGDRAYRSMLAKLTLEEKAGAAATQVGWSPCRVGGGQKDFKGRYYFEKLQLTPVHTEEHKKLQKAYLEGLIWCLAYYYEGCISWEWFFPYHYGTCWRAAILGPHIKRPHLRPAVRHQVLC